MPYDPDLADRVRPLLPGAEEKRMFGGLAFLVGGHMAVAASSTGGLMVRVDPVDADALLGQRGVAPVQMGGRGAMRGWLGVEASALTDPADLERWVRRASAYVQTLPPKA